MNCPICQLPLATDEDYYEYKQGEGFHLCWREFNHDICDGDAEEELLKCREEIRHLNALLDQYR